MWRLRFSKKADRQLSKMDAGVRRVILAWLMRNIDGCDDPRACGLGLTADKSGIWRYRVGDYRVLCDIQGEELVVLAIEIGHRRDIYK
ncbi:MAG: type II toxin-antitoxin system RelE/ParE family toxin [Coriobacteriia bacterium]|nr:type II toxin-antitoxin system RelE/ParE family toxin [Coriobacteriia bacterium]